MTKPDNFAQRLASAKQHLARAQKPAPSQAPAAQSLAIGWRLVLELLATMGVGGFCGWWLDRWLGSAPLFLLSLIFLGSAAGIWSIYRQSRNMRMPSAEPKNNHESPPS